jgi:uncharacterized membrane protein YgcG
MKTRDFQGMMAVVAIASIVFLATTTQAQESTAIQTQPAAIAAPAMQLSEGVMQILQLAQAKVGDDTIVAYIKNSGHSFSLNADQIIYLHQQGLSSAVITTMLNQPRGGIAVATPAASYPEAGSYSAGYNAAATPNVTYVQSAPAPTYYYPPANYYYPAYSYYPGWSFSIGWGGCYGGGCYYGYPYYCGHYSSCGYHGNNYCNASYYCGNGYHGGSYCYGTPYGSAYHGGSYHGGAYYGSPFAYGSVYGNAYHGGGSYQGNAYHSGGSYGGGYHGVSFAGGGFHGGGGAHGGGHH